MVLDYDAFANALREIDKNEDVLVTVWQGGSRTVHIWALFRWKTAN